MSSPGYNFTERVRKVLAMAREEAARLQHPWVDSEHLLLGLLREGEGVAAAVLQNLGADLDELMTQTEALAQKGKKGEIDSPDLPYTSRAKKILELTMAEARDFSHSFVGTEHLLLGIIREEKGVGAQVLAQAGITHEAARAETLRILGDSSPDDANLLSRIHTVRRRVAGEHPAAEEAVAWQRVRDTLDIATRLQATATVVAESAHALRVTLPGHFSIVVQFPDEVEFLVDS